MQATRRRQENNRQNLILLSIAAIIGLIFFISLVSTQIAFNVMLQSQVSNTQGDWEFVDLSGNVRAYQSDYETGLPVGAVIRLLDGATAQVEIVQDSSAFAYLSNGAIWRVLQADRHATAVDHIQQQGDYVVVIEQIAGTVVYDFSQSEPALDEFNMVLRFEDGEYSPEWDCFQATAPTVETPSAVVPVPCR